MSSRRPRRKPTDDRAGLIYRPQDPWRVEKVERARAEWRIDSLSEAAEVARTLEAKTVERVLWARGSGASWDEVAEALGVTRQAAWARFHRIPQAHHPRRQRDVARVEGACKTLSFVRQQAASVEAITRDLITRARHEGRSWEDIASELGIRRQSAWERYGPVKAKDEGSRKSDNTEVVSTDSR